LSAGDICEDAALPENQSFSRNGNFIEKEFSRQESDVIQEEVS